MIDAIVCFCSWCLEALESGVWLEGFLDRVGIIDSLKTFEISLTKIVVKDPRADTAASGMG
jgi:hypothetical protein